MKACSACYRLYPADAGFCAVDGTELRPYADVSAQPSDDDRHLGKTLADRYEIRRIVADGGMGRVYEARDNKADHRVAVKVLHAEVARDPIAVERFRREFEISKDLPHDHIVEVLDFQELSPTLLIMVMEFLEGEELRTVLKREKIIAPPRLIRMMAQVALGLDEAHRRQFVHRDLKPDNLFLCELDKSEGERIKLLDFGSVRINKNRQMSKITSLGTTIGSPFYMSPEQAQGAEGLDHRADVFALGAITYECLTGSVPFTGNNGPAILLAILTKNPPPVSTQSEQSLPGAVDDVIDDALAKKPEMRTHSVGAFADALGHAFGLTGDHTVWAKTPLVELSAQVAVASSNPLPARETADPFGGSSEPDPFATAPRIAQPAATASARDAMDAAFEQAAVNDAEAAGVPKRSPLVFVILGVLIVAGVAAAIALK